MCLRRSRICSVLTDKLTVEEVSVLLKYSYLSALRRTEAFMVNIEHHVHCVCYIRTKRSMRISNTMAKVRDSLTNV